MPTKAVIVYSDSGINNATLVELQPNEELDDVSLDFEASGIDRTVIAVVEVDHRTTSNTVEIDAGGVVLVHAHLTEEGEN